MAKPVSLIRPLAFIVGLCAVSILLVAGTNPPAAQANESRSADAGASIVNGQSTSIKKWPWQVALAIGQNWAPGSSARQRFFCGGAVLARRLVVTAGHCVADFSRSEARNLEVISGRSRLDSNGGRVSRVRRIHMPKRHGDRLFNLNYGAVDWDVALLTLASPVSVKPIKLAGPDESETWDSGSPAWATGWGITKASSNRIPAKLQVTRQTIMSAELCERSNGSLYQSSRMICSGSPVAESSACQGDSGGPVVVKTSAGYRLAGLTSFGDVSCREHVPSVSTGVSGSQIRNWVARKAKNLTGRNVVGHGADSGTTRDWCEVPAIYGLSLAQAEKDLEAANCRLGQVLGQRRSGSGGFSGRVVDSSLPPGWLASPDFALRVWVTS